MTEKSELAAAEEPQEKPLVPVASTSELVAAMRRYEELRAALLAPDRDTYEIQGQTRIRKSGWRKLALAFGISDEIVEERLERDPLHVGEMTWHVRVRCWVRGGRTVEGVGSASSRERPYAHLEHDLHALAHTRAKSRAIADMLGSSDLVAEELEEAEAPAPAAVARASQSEGFRGPGPQPKRDAGQHGVIHDFLEEVLGSDLHALVRLEERDGALYVALPREHVDRHGNAFIHKMMAWGYGIHETPAGLAVRLEAPKAR